MPGILEDLQAALGAAYVIERELGRGGMAIVFLARDLRHDRLVALKTLRPELVPALGPDRFLREIQIAARLQHPNILPLHDSGEAGGLLYYVMPYVEGESLRARLEREGQLPIEDALQIARQVAEALAYAHSHDIVHRDIKPENILLSGGHPLVADFGIARAITAAGGERLTDTGLAVGTAAYMSPEQAAGEARIDGRSDIYSLGCVLYEMLVGNPPFTGASAQAVVARKLTDPVPPPRTVRETVSEAVEQVIFTALARAPADRFPTAGHLVKALELVRGNTAVPPSRSAARQKHPAWSRPYRQTLLLSLAATGGLAVLGGYFWDRKAKADWARMVALPEAIRLNGEGRLYQAFRLLRQAQARLPDDPIANDLAVEWTGSVNIRTSPSGAQVYVRDFFDSPDSADYLGSTPLNEVRLPLANLVWRITSPGFETKEALEWTRYRNLEFSLSPSAESRSGMVHVGGGGFSLDWLEPVELDDYWIDRYEVTNRAFMTFVDAGGYEKREHWQAPLVRDGRDLSWDQARNLLRDKTGRPGPATWESGTYPEGEADHPVSGLSWYEAAAYCRFAGKQLPTLYHWYHAADLTAVSEFAHYGNFESKGPVKVGHPLRFSGNGTYDMAGNVKEWSWTEATPERRYLLGGGWSEPSYQFSDYDAQRSFDRQPTYGVRCAAYRNSLPPALTGSVKPRRRDYSREIPANDEIFGVYRSMYQYDRLPLEARVDSVEQFGRWSVEHVSFVAADNKERVHALLYLPRDAPRPYQTVLYVPGASAFRQQREGSSARQIQGDWFLFLVRSGRAVIVPLYRGTQLQLPGAFRDAVVRASKDIGRALDYVAARPELDSSRVAYLGLSMGASLGPIMTAVEPRFKASALIAGSLPLWRNPPESEALSFLPRVRIPTLMINGRFDFFFPYEESQLPMYRLLGTPPEHKRHRLFDSGHVPLQRQAVMKEILDWLDRYLGLVTKS